MKNPFGSQGPPGWLVTGGIASVALGYLILAFLPAQKSIGLLRRQLLDKDQHVAASQQLATTLAAANGQLEEVEKFTKEWKDQAPTSQQLGPVYAEISERARQAGVRMVRFEPQPARTHSLVAENGLAVVIEGKFADVFTFLKGVEDLPQTIWIRNVNMQRVGAVGNDLRCDLTLTIFGDLADKID